jgi:2-polyprenyl-3-methyl-5-hydroxy-6-metoxy-1,4-benzoquinol methylase
LAYTYRAILITGTTWHPDYTGDIPDSITIKISYMIKVPVFDDYLMSRTSAEYQRLHIQALTWEKITNRVLLEAGLSEGMDFLDVGCGTGDVMRLAGNVITHSGSVTGVDIDENIGAESLALLLQLNNSKYSFIGLDITKDTIYGQYDFVYSRLLITHMTDPLAIIKKLYDAVRPGGILLIQDYDFAAIKTNDKLENITGYMRYLMLQLFPKTGRDPEAGTNLSKYFIDASIGKPDGTDASSIVTPVFIMASMLKSVTFSYKHSILEHGVATEERLAQYINDLDAQITAQENEFCLWPMLNSAWIQKMAV